MRKFIVVLSFLILGINVAFALPGDTLVVQTFTFADGRQSHQGKFEFPDGTVRYEKVLMYYTLKCDPTKSPACGEWDYIFNTEILIPTGVDPENGKDIYESWKLGSYITPYGNGLTLGAGWTWVYDVSDYVHFLKDSVIIKEGNYQELMDLKFVFIEGTPPRDVIGIRKVWDGDYRLSQFDEIVKDTTLLLTPTDVQAKLRTTVTGHGFGTGNNCAEFCNNFHTLKVNGQTLRRWNIIQPCADNPLYPQGGTWIYSRAGWCPGKEATTNEFDLTPYITDHSLRLDYDIQYDPDGNYRTFIYLVTYGENNHTVDVAVDNIIAPTNNFLQLRFNPTSGHPVVVIKNTGSNPLTTVDIQYSFPGKAEYTYSWQGNLAFLEKDTVLLPIPDWNLYPRTGGTFRFELVNPNGQLDPTPYNNVLQSTFIQPPIYTNHDFQFYFMTNDDANETSWKLFDVEGNVLYENQKNLQPNTVYTQDMDLKDGSYRISLYDTGDDGIAFWAYGTDGAARLRKPGKVNYTNVYTFNGDFGRFIHFDFAINRYNSVVGLLPIDVVKNIPVFPNPAQSDLFIDLSDLFGKALSIEIIDVSGQLVLQTPVAQLQVNKIEIGHLPAGVYILVVKDAVRQVGKSKFIKQ